MSKAVKIISIISLCFFVVGISNFAYAVIELEVEFPEIAGQKLTGESTLPQVIKYALNIFIIAAILAVLISLVYGGISYLTSTGNPTAMSKGRQRIIGSAFGLAILLGSYLILQFVNPQLTVLKIKKIPVVSGVVLLNKAAMQDPKITGVLGSGAEEEIKETIQELLDAPNTRPRAVLLRQQKVSDLSQMFGELGLALDVLGQNVSNYYTFKNFELYGLYFLPGANVKVLSYSSVDFRNAWTALMDIKSKTPDNQYVYPDCSAVGQRPRQGPCLFKLVDGISEYREQQGFGVSQIHQPPLSLLVKGIARGVYLYSDTLGDEVYLQDRESERFLRDRDFNNQTKRIEIRNWLSEDGDYKKTTNYVAILHEDDRFRGNLRIFFEDFLYGKDELEKNGNLGTASGLDCQHADIECVIEVDGATDVFGKVEKPSSAQVFQMPATKEEWAEWEEQGCKVTVCSETGLGGGCFIYDEPLYDKTVFYPHTITEKGKFINEDGIEEEVSLSDNIRSMKIEGNCVVVLFENPPTDSDFPGKNSEVFTFWSEEYIKSKEEVSGGGYLDLTPDNRNFLHKIGYCGGGCRKESIFGNLSLECKPCASAIAIYPVKGPASFAPSVSPTSGLNWQNDWKNCLDPNEITNIPEQKSEASSALIDLLDCIAREYGSGVTSAPCDWYVTSISDSAGLKKCAENYEKPPCAHKPFSWHYGGEDCYGEASYAADLVPNDWGESQRLEDAIDTCTPNWQLETNPKHFHADMRNACAK